MPDECVHHVDFDRLEIERYKRGRHRISASCTKCQTRVTLDQVLSRLIEKVIELEARLGGEKEKDDGEPAAGSGT